MGFYVRPQAAQGGSGNGGFEFPANNSEILLYKLLVDHQAGSGKACEPVELVAFCVKAAAVIHHCSKIALPEGSCSGKSGSRIADRFQMGFLFCFPGGSFFSPGFGGVFFPRGRVFPAGPGLSRLTFSWISSGNLSRASQGSSLAMIENETPLRFIFSVHFVGPNGVR